MAYMDPTAFANALKKWHPDGFERIPAEESSFFAWVPKRTDWQGGDWEINPLINNGNGSADFPTALGVQSNPVFPKFGIDTRENFHVFGISSQLLLRARGKKGAVDDALKTRTDAALEDFGIETGIGIWGNGGGARGRIATTTTITSQTVVLTDARDVAKYRPGMKLQLSTDDGIAGAGVLTGEMTVATLTSTGFTIVEAAINSAVLGAATTNYIFRKGDYGKVIQGVKGWIPTTAPTTGDSWMGYDRSVYPDLLAGYRHNGGGRLFEQELVRAVAKGPGKYTTAFANSERVADVINSMQAKSRISYELKTVEQKVSQHVTVAFTGIVFATPKGPIMLVGDKWAPYDDVLITRKEAWEFRSAGTWPHFEKAPNGEILHLSPTADGQQARVKGYGNLGCNRPGDCILFRPDAT